MSESASNASKQADRSTPVARAEHLLDRFGQQLQLTRMRAAARAQGGGTGHAQRPPVDRAEDLLDRAGTQIGHFAARTTHDLRRLLARAREEAEDWWVEAQQMRQNGQQNGARERAHEHSTKAH